MNRIICGDCIDVMSGLDDESVKVVVTSPPYNLRNSSGNGLKDGRGGSWSNAALLKGYSDHDDNMPADQYVEWQRACLTQMMRLLRDDGVIFYNHKWRVQKGLMQDRSDIVSGFPVRQIIIWKRSGGFNFNPGYFVPTYEVIYVIAKPKFRLAKGANSHGDVWSITQDKGNPHPASFPVELASRCISSCDEGLVLDPFAGSGSTAVAAAQLGRDCISIDQSQEYCDMAEKRLNISVAS